MYMRHINNSGASILVVGSVRSCTGITNQIVGIIRRTFVNFNKETLLMLYKSIVRPRLEYAVVVWIPFLKKDIKLIESVQRRFTKIIPECREKLYAERLKLLSLPSLIYRRKRSDMIQVYKILHGTDVEYRNKFKVKWSVHLALQPLNEN